MDENSHHTPIHQGTQVRVSEVTGFWKNSLGLQAPALPQAPPGLGEWTASQGQAMRPWRGAPSGRARSDPASRRYKDEGGLACGKLPITSTRPNFHLYFFKKSGERPVSLIHQRKRCLSDGLRSKRSFSLHKKCPPYSLGEINKRVQIHKLINTL